MTKQTIKKYLVSSLLSFLAGFCATILIDINNITPDSFRDGTIWGILFLAVRTGIKGLIEWFLVTFYNK